MYINEITNAFISSMIISPVMTVIDLSVIKSQIDNLNFYKSIKITLNELKTKKINIKYPLFVMNNVYFLTYSTANITEKYCKKNNIDYKIPTLISTSIINIIMINYKDKEFLNIYNTTYKFKKISFFLFSIRDMLTIYSTFILKKDVNNKLLNYTTDNKADFLSTLVTPIFIQIWTTPIHILSIDIYQRPKSNINERIKKIKNNYINVCLGRMLRVIPAFCLGGYINEKLKKY